jgi:hypothetical protein
MYKIIAIIAGICLMSISGCKTGTSNDQDLITGPYKTETFISDSVVTRHILKHFNNSSGAGEAVPPLVFAVGFNNDFIVAKQHPTAGYEKKYEVDPSVTYYYLIDINGKFFKSVSNDLGPLTKHQFDSVQAYYKIPDIPFTKVYPEHNDAFIDGKVILRK